mgnify:CR=1 FL=1
MSDKIQKFLQTLPFKVKKELLAKLQEIQSKGLSSGDIKPYKGQKGWYRLRVGKIRVLFVLKDQVLHVQDIDFRGQIYKTQDLNKKQKPLSFYEEKIDN